MNVSKNIFMVGGANGDTMPLSLTVEAKSDVCTVSITGYINEWTTASATQAAKDIKAAKDAGATTCVIYVNSPGGNVFQANEISNLIEDNFEADKITVKVGALCASAGTIFPAKYPSTGKANTQCMIHKPSMYIGGNEDKIKASLKLLKDLTADYRAMYAQKFNKTEEEIDALWEKGDYWMNAKDAKKMGLLDNIESEKEKISAEMRLQLVACGAPEIPQPEAAEKPKNKNPKPIVKMELSVLAVTLGLPATASQAEVDAKLAEIQALATKAAALEQAAEDKAKADKAAKIKAILDQGEKDKKFNPAMRANYEAIGENNIEQLEAIMADMKPMEAVSRQITPGTETTASGEDQSKWTFADFQAKDPDAFVKMTEEDPKRAEALVNAHYKEV